MEKSIVFIVELVKSLYGLKQAAYKFKDYFIKTLTALGFRRLCCDSSMYLGLYKGNKILLTRHADDIMLMFLSSNIEDM